MENEDSEDYKPSEEQTMAYAQLLTELREIARKEAEREAKKDLDEWIEFSKQFMK